VLEGPEGLGRWVELHGQLVARRNRLVAQLGEAFQVRDSRDWLLGLRQLCSLPCVCC
jgi:hypothetical protein